MFFIALHQVDLYSVGLEAIGQLCRGQAVGCAVDVPLPAGTGNPGSLDAFDRIVLPIPRQVAPDLIIVSAGQDARVLGPLGPMALTTSAYRAMTYVIRRVAGASCGGRLVDARESGYASSLLTSLLGGDRGDAGRASIRPDLDGGFLRGAG